LLVALAAFTCWLLRISFWRWLRWMAIPIGFLLVVLTILFSVSRISICWWASRWGYWLGVLPEGLTMANTTFWRSLAALAATFWLVLNLPFRNSSCYSEECRV
jgi:cobalt/nickel transport system permease protein